MSIIHLRKEQSRAIELIKMPGNITNKRGLNELELVHGLMKKVFYNRIVISWFYYSVKIKYEEINLNWNSKQKNIRLQMSIAVIYVFLLQSSFINT